MTDEELMESLDRHFLAGCPSLSAAQLEQHKATGSCPDCVEAAGAAWQEAEQPKATRS